MNYICKCNSFYENVVLTVFYGMSLSFNGQKVELNKIFDFRITMEDMDYGM